MARHRRSSTLETRAARLRLDIRRKPYFLAIAPGVSVGYRRCQGPGRWLARGSDGHGGHWEKVIAVADDHENADGNAVLTFWQAQDRSKEIVRGPTGGERPATVAEALEHYAADLKARGGSAANVRMVSVNLPTTLAAKSVALLTARELRHWRDAMVSRGLKAATADRTARALMAALNLAARDDARITNTGAWKNGLKRLPEAEPPANRIIGDNLIRKIVAAAHRLNPDFGLLVELGAVTGARPSQLLRLEVGDLNNRDKSRPTLSMPSSKKGKRRRVTRTPLPVPPTLAEKLRRHAADRDRGEPLLFKDNGNKQAYGRMWRQMAADLGLDTGVSFYSLRHSSIVRQLLAGVPVRIVAAGHDTSVMMLEFTYSRHIGTVSDALVRAALIDVRE